MTGRRKSNKTIFCYKFFANCSNIYLLRNFLSNYFNRFSYKFFNILFKKKKKCNDVYKIKLNENVSFEGV